jgi:HTH-type transcriptional regulator, glycine betaine synthesis regulator
MKTNSLAEPVEGLIDDRVFERELIDLFVHFAQMLSLPRSIGGIYGLLFTSQEPLTLDDVCDRLQIAKGSASQGLRFLREANAIHATYLTGDRRTHYVAERGMRRLTAGFLNDRLMPQLAFNQQRIEELLSNARNLPEDRSYLADRLENLQTWHRKARRMLPLILRLIGTPSAK